MRATATLVIWAALATVAFGQAGTVVPAEDVPPTPVAPPDQNPPAASADDVTTPVMTLDGTDDKVEFGELIDLKAAITPPTPKWLVDKAYGWTILPTRDKVVVWPDNSRIVFGSGNVARTYTVIVTGSFVYALPGTDGKVTTVTQRQVTIIKTVQVGDPTPATPPAKPDQGPSSSANTSLGEAILEWTADLKMPSEAKFSGLTVLARSFRGIAAQIDSGTLKTPQEIIAKTRASNDMAIADHKTWAPWFTNLNKRLEAMAKDGKLNSPEQYAETWRTIAASLESFR